MNDLKILLLSVFFAALSVGLLVCSAPKEYPVAPSVEGLYRVNKSLLFDLSGGHVDVMTMQMGIMTVRREGTYKVKGDELVLNTTLTGKRKYRIVYGDGIMLVGQDTLTLEVW